MKTITAVLLFGALVATMPAAAQIPREDVIWARVSPAPIVLDGVLDEAAWSQAESRVVVWEQDAGIPGSGWKTEAGWDPVDPTYATLKFLVRGNELYLGAVVEDQSIGGSREFNRFDGFLMALKDRADVGFPKPPAEYFYAWWYAEDTDPQPAGQDPAFIGRWAEWPPGTPRTAEQIANWDAATVVEGLSNDDGTLDTSYTVEMRFNLTPMGYDVTQVSGDVVEWNISVYDTDWFWPIDALQFSSNRVWWQSPWGNAAWYNEVRVLARPDVTVNSGPVPAVEPEMVIANLTEEPVVDGALDEAVWDDPNVYTFDIRWDDVALRESYDGVGPYRSGQYQPTVNGGLADILDPADATVKVLHSGANLYFGFDVRDGVVQYHANINRWDGFLITINDRVELHSDNNLLGRRLSFQVGLDGNAEAQDYLLTLVQGGNAQVAIELAAGTTVDTFGTQVDNGYTAEVAFDLTALGYPPDLGDGAFFFGVTLLDGDSFPVVTDSYGTRTWWYREYENECCAPWAYLEPAATAAPGESRIPDDYAVVRNSASPSDQPQVYFTLPEPNVVTFEVFDLRGRLVERRQLGAKGTGEIRIPLFVNSRPAAGIYLYRLTLVDPSTGAPRATLQGKTMLVK